MLSKAINRLFGLSRGQKRLLQLTADATLLTLSFLVAMFLRLDHWRFLWNVQVWYALAAFLPLSLLVFIRLGFYRAVIRYIGGKAVRTIIIGVIASATMLAIISQAFGLFVPRSVPLIYALLAFMTVGGVRFSLRAIYFQRQTRRKARVIIYGAGSSGRQLLSSLKQGPEYAPVAFVDDDPELLNTQIDGIRVHASSDVESLVSDYGVREVLLAIPSASQAERAAILARMEPLPVHVKTIPGIADLVSGKAKIGEVREVSIEDMLGRDPVPPRQDLLQASIRGKTVLVTGAGGSIGGELCRQILRLGPARLVLMDLSEYALYAIDQELQAITAGESLDVAVEPVIGSVQNPGRTAALLRRFAVETVYHAAAYKHVPLVEQNEIEGVRNNVFGTLTLAQACIAAGVREFILVSTDKAVRPTNVMGASKRIAELVCQALAMEQTGTRFSMVRFGNVLGSSGSVVPLFRRQIAAGGPITVTHRDITRYFMTIPEAAQLVIQAGAMARGGDVFVLDMGEPVRILDLAMRLVRLSGLKPVVVDGAVSSNGAGKDVVPITFTQLRPGEKLYEELLIGDNPSMTEHPRILSAQELALPWKELEGLLDRLKAACDGFDSAKVRAVLKSAPIAYAAKEPPRAFTSAA